MMRKLKRLLAILFASLFTLMVGASVSACQSMEDIVPEKYGEWDGNYIYRGNGRAKTTAEDYEQLVQSVELFGESYTVLDCVDFEIKDDDMYLILKCDYSDILEDIYCLVKYDIKNKTQTLLTHDTTFPLENAEFYYRPIEIAGVYEDCVLLQANVIKNEYLQPNIINWENGWYKVDLNHFSEEAVEEDFSNYVWASKEYLIAEKYNSSTHKYELYYRKGHFSEAVCISDVLGDSENWSYTYVEKNRMKGLVIKKFGDYNKIYGCSFLISISFFNLETQELTSCEVGAYATWVGEMDYLKIYNLKTIEYYEMLFEKKKGDVEYNNEIKKVVYAEDGIRLEPLCDLNENCKYDIYALTGDKFVYREAWYESWRGCKFGGEEYKYYEQDLKTNERREIEYEEMLDLEDKYAVIYELEKGITFGDYIYFLHEETIYNGLMAKSGLAYMLKRYNIKTQEIEVMQLWYGDPRDSQRHEYEKFSGALWFTCGYEYDFYEFAVRNY